MFLLDIFEPFCAGWLWPLLWLLTMLLLGLLLGWLLSGKYGKNSKRVIELESENNSLRAKLSAGGAIATGAVASVNADLKDRISGLEANLSGAKSTEADLRARIAGLEADLAACNKKNSGFLAAAAAPVSTKDDLKKIEGIGPKIESILNDAGIQTFARLAETPASRLSEILLAAGERFRIHNPGTWPRQAELARDGRWHELNYWQDLLDGGKGPEFDSLVIPPPASDNSDDLKKVEGIGPAIEKLLHNAGIRTFVQLAGTKPERIREILDAAGERFRIHNPGTWPEQAAMARDGRWDELNAWQDELKGGK